MNDKEYETDDLLYPVLERVVERVTDVPAAEAFVRAYMDDHSSNSGAIIHALAALVGANCAADAAMSALRHYGAHPQLFFF